MAATDDEGIAIVAGQKSVGTDDCNGQDSEVEYVPLKVVKPESMESGPKKSAGRRIKERAQKIKAKKRKKTWPAGSKSAKSDKDDNIIPTRKRGRPEGSKSAKRKMGRKPAFTHICSSDSEGKRDGDDDFDPTVRKADVRKKYKRVQGICGPAFKRVSEVQEKFLGGYPTFTRCMVPSNVLRVFWLHISSDFCREYLPECDARMTLEDENGQRDYANYLRRRCGLSGGWRGFATDHSLKVGDTVVFQLVMPTKFKVYIRRKDDFTTTDDDARSKEDAGVTTRDGSSAPRRDADNHASEEAPADDDVDGMRSPEPGIKDSDGVPSLVINPELFPDCLRRTYNEEVKLEKNRAAEKMRSLKSKMATVKDAMRAVDVEMEEIESSMKKYAQAVRKMATAPW